jgi:uncharacterized membrane protein YdbT with pleckstrin-like domain
MGYPKRLLSDDEVIVSEFRPHWSAILKEGALILLAVVLVILIRIYEWWDWLQIAVIVVALLIVARELTRYFTTQHVITNERVIHRTGLISKHGKEIPHEVINDVEFRQGMMERILGSGDLLIESAGTHGQSRYTDIPSPEDVQKLIYEVREKRIEATQGGSGAVESAASQLQTLSELHDAGKLTDAEFEEQKRRLLGNA